MRLKIGLLALAGTILAFSAAGLSFAYLNAARKEMREARQAVALWGDTIEVPILKSGKVAGSTLQPEDFEFHKLPKTYISAAMMRSLPDLSEGAVLVTTRELRAGELLSGADLAVKEASDADQQAVALRRLDGHQLTSLQFRNYAQMAPYIGAERSVDIFWTSRTDGQTRLLSSAAMVVALPPRESGADAQESLLLSLSPEDSARALHAGRDGDFDLTLSAGPRSLDQGMVQVSSVELRDLPLAYREGVAPAGGSLFTSVPLGGYFAPEADNGAAAPASKSQRPTCQASIVRGGQRVSVDVPC